MSEAKDYHEYDMLSALAWLQDIERKNGGLLNGNFSMAAHEHKLKVKDVRDRWAQMKEAE